MSVELNGKKIEVKVKNNLHTLNLKKKNIKDISDIKGLEKLTELKVLNLSKNQISKIESLENLSNLQELDLSNNKIEDVEGLANLKNLEILNLDRNPYYYKFLKIFPYKRTTSYGAFDKFLSTAMAYYAIKSLDERREDEKRGKIKLKDKKVAGIEVQEIINKIEHYIKEYYLKEPQIYIPIEYSDLLEKFRNYVNKEDVIYSTFCKLRFALKAGPHTRAKLFKISWESHALITKDVFLYSQPPDKRLQGFKYKDGKTNPIKYICSPWGKGLTGNIGITEAGNIIESFAGILTGACAAYPTSEFRILPIQIKEFESDEIFNIRSKKFSPLCQLLEIRAIFNSSLQIEYYEEFYKTQKLLLEQKEKLEKIIHL